MISEKPISSSVADAIRLVDVYTGLADAGVRRSDAGALGLGTGWRLAVVY